MSRLLPSFFVGVLVVLTVACVAGFLFAVGAVMYLLWPWTALVPAAVMVLTLIGAAVRHVERRIG